MYMRNIRQQPVIQKNKTDHPVLFLSALATPALAASVLATLLSLLFSSASFALTSDTKQPVKIDASSVTFNKTKGYAVYEGGVSITQGTLKIEASKIEIFAPNNAIKKIEATGSPVSFEQKMDDGKWARGEANNVSYLVKEKKLILAGNATLSQDKDTFSSQYIQYSTNTGELKAGNSPKDSKKSNDRVRAIFYPAPQ